MGRGGKKNKARAEAKKKHSDEKSPVPPTEQPPEPLIESPKPPVEQPPETEPPTEQLQDVSVTEIKGNEGGSWANEVEEEKRQEKISEERAVKNGRGKQYTREFYNTSRSEKRKQLSDAEKPSSPKKEPGKVRVKNIDQLRDPQEKREPSPSVVEPSRDRKGEGDRGYNWRDQTNDKSRPNYNRGANRDNSNNKGYKGHDNDRGQNKVVDPQEKRERSPSVKEDSVEPSRDGKGDGDSPWKVQNLKRSQNYNRGPNRDNSNNKSYKGYDDNNRGQNRDRNRGQYQQGDHEPTKNTFYNRNRNDGRGRRGDVGKFEQGTQSRGRGRAFSLNKSESPVGGFSERNFPDRKFPDNRNSKGTAGKFNTTPWDKGAQEETAESFVKKEEPEPTWEDSFEWTPSQTESADNSWKQTADSTTLNPNAKPFNNSPDKSGDWDCEELKQKPHQNQKVKNEGRDDGWSNWNEQKQKPYQKPKNQGSDDDWSNWNGPNQESRQSQNETNRGNWNGPKQESRQRNETNRGNWSETKQKPRWSENARNRSPDKQPQKRWSSPYRSGRGDPEFDEFYKFLKSFKGDFVKVNEVEGDLFAMSQEYSLAHCVAEDFSMGSGIAVLFSNKFKRREELYHQRQQEGGLAVLQDKARYIYYLVTKQVSQGKPTMYTMWCSLQKMLKHMEENNVTKLAMPRIGCGLDRLDWDKVKPMIEYTFRNMNVEIVVCNLQQTEGTPSPRSTHCYVKHVAMPLVDIEAETAIIVLGTENGFVSDTIQSLNAKFGILGEYKSTAKSVGQVLRFPKKGYVIYAFIVGKTEKEPLDLINFATCIHEFRKLCKKDPYYYIGIEAFEENRTPVIFRVVNVLKQYAPNSMQIYVCWPSNLRHLMPGAGA